MKRAVILLVVLAVFFGAVVLTRGSVPLVSNGLLLISDGLLMDGGLPQNMLPCAPTGSEKVATDQAHYSVHETMQLSGSGHQPYCPVTVRLNGPNGRFDAIGVTTDANGTFTLPYILDYDAGKYEAAVYLDENEEPWTSVMFSVGPYLEVDSPDYAPGNRVTVSGGNWQPSETVEITIHEIDGPDADLTMLAVADETGTITNGDFVTDVNDLGIHFQATGRGLASAGTARVTFTDGFTATSRASASWNADSTWSITRLGKISWVNGSKVITGDGSGGQNFVNDLAVGNVITLVNDTVIGTVASIDTATKVTLAANVTLSTQTLQTYKARRVPAATDDAVIGNNDDVTVTAPASVNSLDITAANGTSVVIDAGQSLTVGGAVTVTGSGATNLVAANGTLNAGSLAISGGGNGSSIGKVTVGTSGVVAVSGTITINQKAGSALLDSSSGAGTVSAGSLDMTANSTSGTPVSQINMGTGSISVAGDFTSSSCAHVGTGDHHSNCILTFSAAGIAHVGGNLGTDFTLQNFTTSPGSTIDFNGSGNGSIPATNTLFIYQNLSVTKTGAGAATLAGSTTVNGNITVTSGTLAAGGSPTITLAGGVSNNGTISFDGGSAGCGSADTLLIRSTVAGTQRSWSGSGTFNISDASVQDQGGSVTALSSTNVSNNGWTFNAGCSASTTTTTTVTSSSPSNTSAYGDLVTFTGTVTPGVTAGSVNFIEGGNCATPTTVLQAATTVDGNGQVTFATSTLTVPSHIVTACYSGSGNFTASNGSVTQTVNVVTVTITASSPSVTYGDPIPAITPGFGAFKGIDTSAVLTTQPTCITGYTPTSNAGTTPSTSCSGAVAANYSFSYVAGHVTISQADANITVNGYTGVYDGTAHGASGSAAGVESPTPVNLSSLLHLGSTFSNAPGGTANWTFNGNTNYKSTSGSVSITISQADASITVNGYTGVYDGTAHGASGSAAGVESPTPVNLSSLLHLGSTFSNAPGGTANWTFDGNTNYKSTSGSVSITISQADASITVNGYTGVYDGTAHGATGSAAGVESPTPVNLSSLLHLGSTFSNAPGGTANWTFDGNTNYKSTSGSVSITISQADASITVNGYTGVYDGTAHGATGSAAGVESPTPANLSSLLHLGSTFSNAPGGTANWTFDGNTNYKSTSGSVSITISQSDANITVNGYTGVYDGTAHGATGSAAGVESPTPANLSSLLHLGSTFSNAPGGTANWTFDGNTNYKSTSGSVSITISQADASITVNGYTGVYDGAAHGATGSAAGVESPTPVNLSSLLHLGSTFSNAPGGTANWTFNGNTNYKSTSGSVSITISQADASITVNGYTGVYDGTAHGATGSAAGVESPTPVNLSSLLHLGSTFSNAPGGTANWTFDGNTNYKSTSGSVSITISQATLTIHVTAATPVTYTGLSYAGATACTADGINNEHPAATLAFVGTGSTTYALSATPPTNAGAYNAQCSAGGPGTNYEAKSSTAPLVIGAATPTVTVAFSPESLTYDSGPHPATVTVTGMGRANLNSGHGVITTTYTPGNSTVPVNVGSYKASAHFASTDGNYTDADGATNSLTINLATLTISVTAVNTPYTGLPYAGATTCKATGLITENPSATLSYQDASHNTLPGAPTTSGNYFVLCSAGGTGTNYEANSKTAAFTIGKLTPSFSNLTSTSVAFGTASTTVSGTIKSGTLYPTGNVSITLKGVTQSAAINATTGYFSSSFATGALTVPAPGPTYTITYHYTGDTNFNASSDGTGSLTVTAVATISSVTVTPNSAQYSDLVSFSVTLSPNVTAGVAPAGNVKFTFGTQTTSTVALTASGGSLTATVSNFKVTQPAGSYTATAVFTDPNANFSILNPTTPLTVAKEHLGGGYTGMSGGMFTAGPTIGTAPVLLSAHLDQDTDGSLGDITLARIHFDLFKGGNTGTTPDVTVANLPLDANGNAATTVSLGVDTWTIRYYVEYGNGYWTSKPSYSDLTTLNIDYGSVDKRASGGGWIADSLSANGKGNSGFTVNYQKTGTPKGNMVYVFRGMDGYDYVVKANSWQGGGLIFYSTTPSRATFSGRCNVQKIDPATGASVASWGNYAFTVDVVDGDQLVPKQPDQYGITILDSNNLIWRQIPRVPMGGGNLAVFSK